VPIEEADRGKRRIISETEEKVLTEEEKYHGDRRGDGHSSIRADREERSGIGGLLK